MTPVQLRPPTDDELVLVRDSWARTFGERHFPPNQQRWFWYRCLRSGIDWVLKPGRSLLLVAHLPEVPTEVLGWVCWEPRSDQRPMALHYVYVKPYIRKRGIATQLLRAALSDADERGYRLTHHTSDGDVLIERAGT